MSDPPTDSSSWASAFAASRSVRAATAMVLLAGLFHGCSVGYVPAYLALHREAADCAVRSSAAACADARHANDCVWLVPDNGTRPAGACVFPDHVTTDCGAAAVQTKAACKAYAGLGRDCFWDTVETQCKHTVGYGALQQGLFAGAHAFGAVVGPLLGNLALYYTGRFRAVMAMVAAGFGLGLVLEVAARAALVFPLLAIGRLSTGIASTALRFLGPLYAFRSCPLPVAKQVASLAEPLTQTSIALHVLYAFAVEPRSYGGDPAMEVRVQMLHGLPFLAWAAFVCLCLYAPEPATAPPPPAPASAQAPPEPPAKAVGSAEPIHGTPGTHRPALPSPLVPQSEGNPSFAACPSANGSLAGPAACGLEEESTEPTAAVQEAPEVTPWQAMRYIVIGLFAAAPYLGTGMVALLSFMSTFGKDVYGVSNFSAPLIFSGVAVPAGIAGIISRRWFEARPAMLVGTAASIVGLLLIALGAAAWVPSPGRYVVSVTGLVVFVTSLQAGVCPVFFELAIRIMPPAYVGIGSSVLSMALGLYALVTAFLFPVAVGGLSGGPDEDQAQGYAMMCVVFAAIASVSFVVLFKFMHPYDDGMGYRATTTTATTSPSDKETVTPPDDA